MFTINLTVITELCNIYSKKIVLHQSYLNVIQWSFESQPLPYCDIIWPYLYGKSNMTQTYTTLFSSVQFSYSVVSDSLWSHELQHARPPCPSPTPGIYPNPCPWWCHLAISSFVIPFSSCPQSFPASGSFPMRQLFAQGGQSIGVLAM